MTPVFAAQRRAEEFDGPGRGRLDRAVDDARYAQLLELVGAMRATSARPRRAPSSSPTCASG